MELKIESAKTEDAEKIRIAQRLAFEDCKNKYKFCPAYDISTEALEKFLAENYAYKIMIEDKIVGSIFVCQLSHRGYELNTMTIHPGYQNMGIGSRAIEFAESEFPDAETWTLETPEGELRNRHLYEKYGYKVVEKTYINEFLTLLKYMK